MDLSLVIPLLNEEESLPELTAWIERVMDEHHYTYEIIFVDDGSTDNSWEVIQQLRARNPHVKGIKFQRNYGKSAGLNEGFKAAQGEVIITMDADLQDSPDEIPELRRMILEDNLDLVSGWKKKRYDNRLTKNLPSKLFNAAARRMSGIKLHDFNCGLKAYRKKLVKSIEVYGESSGTPRKKIRCELIRMEPLHQWIPRPAFHLFHRQIQQTPDALLWFVGHDLFPDRSRLCTLPGYIQTDRTGVWHYQQARILYITYISHYRCAAIPGRISGRTGDTKFCLAQFLLDRRKSGHIKSSLWRKL